MGDRDQTMETVVKLAQANAELGMALVKTWQEQGIRVNHLDDDVAEGVRILVRFLDREDVREQLGSILRELAADGVELTPDELRVIEQNFS